MLAVLLFITLSIIAVATTSVAGEDMGTLMGDITIVGQENLRDGEVVVSFAGTDDEAGNTGFDSADPHYSIDLAPGDYTAYAWAPVFHNSDRVPFTIVVNETTWVNLTVVRQEEVLGTVSTPKGTPVEDAIVQFLMDGTLVAATETDDEGAYRLEWTRDRTYNRFDLEVGFFIRKGREEKFEVLQSKDLSLRVADGGPVVAPVVIESTLLLDDYREFLASV